MSTRELLEECLNTCMCHNDHAIKKKIQAELAKPDPEPDYWHVVDEDGLSIYSASFKEACQDHINDTLMGDSCYPTEQVAQWVVRPLWSKPCP